LSSATTIAGGDVRVFAVRVQEKGVEEIAHVKPPARPRGRLMPLRAPRGLKEELLARPTFFQHFDGLIVDWRYLGDRETVALTAEARWLQRQGVRVAVDLSSGLNLYPTLRLIDNLPADYLASQHAVSNLLVKMELFGARDLVLSLHRYPENNFSEAQTRTAFDATLTRLASEAARRRITLHLRMAFGKPPWTLADAAALLDRVAAPNLRLAPSTALLVAGPPTRDTAASILKARAGLWLASTPRRDATGQLWDAHGRLHAAPDLESVRSWLAMAPDQPIALDAIYADHDEEYLDAEAVRRSTVVP
jgi:hypothetical protein